MCLVDRSCASVEFVQVSALAAPTLVPCGGVWGPFSADETVTASAVVSVKGSATEVQKEGALLCDAREITASFGVDTAASTAPIILLVWCPYYRLVSSFHILE